MFGDWKVSIIEDFMSLHNKVYLYSTNGRTRQALTKDGIIKTYTEGERGNEDDYFALMSHDQLQAFANSLASKGIRTTNDSKNEGLLEATNKHLEDMRALVFKGVKK